MTSAKIVTGAARELRLVCLSDTHGRHRELAVPGGDVLIHAGDFTQMSLNLAEFEDFATWMEELPHRRKLLIPGNHDFFLEADERRRHFFVDTDVLINESTIVEGICIFGSPTTPLYGGAFGVSSDVARKRIYSGIPADIGILVTHGPPLGILDVDRASGIHMGCAVLEDVVTRLQVPLHIFGHAHAQTSVMSTEGKTTFVNAAVFEREDMPLRPPVSLLLRTQD